LLRGHGKVELPKSAQVEPGKTATKPRGQIGSQTRQQFLPISRPFLATLFKLNDTPTDLPIRRCHERVNRTGTGATRLFEQPAEVAEEVGVCRHKRRGLHGLEGGGEKN
jgi:hypothetical protein